MIAEKTISPNIAELYIWLLKCNYMCISQWNGTLGIWFELGKGQRRRQILIQANTNNLFRENK